jgi:hypothetical protein
MDVARKRVPTAPFDALLDRGCPHGVAPELKRECVRHVAAAARPGAPLLLLQATADRDASVVAPELERMWAEASKRSTRAPS